MDKGRRKRTADVAEKLGVGLLLGTVAQGIFATELSPRTYVIGAVVLAIAAILIVVSIFLSQEELTNGTHAAGRYRRFARGRWLLVVFLSGAKTQARLNSQSVPNSRTAMKASEQRLTPQEYGLAILSPRERLEAA